MKYLRVFVLTNWRVFECIDRVSDGDRRVKCELHVDLSAKPGLTLHLVKYAL